MSLKIRKLPEWKFVHIILTLCGVAYY